MKQDSNFILQGSRQGANFKSAPIEPLIRHLVEIRPDSNPLLSCFFNFEEKGGFTELDNRSEIAARRLTGEQRASFDEAFRQIRDYLLTSIEHGTKGAAVFARWGDDPVFAPAQFGVPLATRFIVDDTPHIYPLIELKDTYHRFVIIITTETEGRILETTFGAVTEDILAERPELRERVGREWTREHYHRHKREKEQQFVREKIRIVDDLMRRRGINHLIVAGSAKMVSRLTMALPPRLKQKLVSIASANPGAGLNPILLESLSLIIAAENIESHDRVEKLKGAVLSGGLGVIGYKACRKALEEGYADILIVDQSFMDEEQREELVKLAARNEVVIETVNRSDTLKHLSGVGCLLRYRPRMEALETQNTR